MLTANQRLKPVLPEFQCKWNKGHGKRRQDLSDRDGKLLP